MLHFLKIMMTTVIDRKLYQFITLFYKVDFPFNANGKEPSASAGDAGDLGSIPWLGRSPRGGNGNLLQYSCLEKPMDRGSWQATVNGVTKNWTRLSMHIHTHT